MQKNIRIITRNSDLAMWQAQHVAEKIKQLYPDTETQIIGITTQGDRFLDTSLDKIGGKGLFIKELEQALINKQADIAVHSLKDLPANLTPMFTIAAILEREDASDVLLSNKYKTLQSIPDDAIIGTSSLRRSAILNRHYPALHVKLLRGNILTRIKKLDNNEYDAIILASAGVKRLNLEYRITEYLPKSIFIPSIGQGALAIECLAENDYLNGLMNKLTHPKTSVEVLCERELGRVLQASCSVPIGAHAVIEKNKLSLEAIVLDKETGIYCTSRIIGHQDSYLAIALECADKLIQNGALKILQKYK